MWLGFWEPETPLKPPCWTPLLFGLCHQGVLDLTTICSLKKIKFCNKLYRNIYHCSIQSKNNNNKILFKINVVIFLMVSGLHKYSPILKKTSIYVWKGFCKNASIIKTNGIPTLISIGKRATIINARQWHLIKAYLLYKYFHVFERGKELIPYSSKSYRWKILPLPIAFRYFSNCIIQLGMLKMLGFIGLKSLNFLLDCSHSIFRI